jgi:hypothetical protein
MKKSFPVLLLAVMSYGCSTPSAVQADNHSLISYDEIAAEIEVSYETPNGSYGWSRPVAANESGSE